MVKRCDGATGRGRRCLVESRSVRTKTRLYAWARRVYLCSVSHEIVGLRVQERQQTVLHSYMLTGRILASDALWTMTMASRIEICKDIEEMLRMFDAGLLLVNYGWDTPVEWDTPGKGTDRLEWARRYTDNWMPSDFGYLVEDE